MLAIATAATALRRRSSYTLIELLVVIAIVGFLAGLLMLMWPNMTASTLTTSNADKVQAMLLIAKQKAIRDKVPTGVRFIYSGNNVTQLIYVSQPDPYTAPMNVNGATGAATATGFLSPVNGNMNLSFTGVDFTGGLAALGAPTTDYPVQPGDYLEINGGGFVHMIMGVQSNQLNVMDTITVANATPNFRIIRQPRPLIGEEPVVLNGGIIIDLSMSKNVPVRNEIVFSPSGGVIGQGTASNGQIILWVRNSQYNPAYPVQQNDKPVLVAVQVGTGLVGGYTVNIGGADPYSETRDPHASGL